MKALYPELPVVGGPRDGATFTPLWDHEPGRWVRLEPAELRPRWAGTGFVLPTHGYRISDDGARVEWRRLL